MTDLLKQKLGIPDDSTENQQAPAAAPVSAVAAIPEPEPEPEPKKPRGRRKRMQTYRINSVPEYISTLATRIFQG